MSISRSAVKDAISGTLKTCTKTGRVTVGQWAEYRRCFGPEEVAVFGGLSGDRNPVHLDAEFAAKTQFKKPIVHGMLYGGMFGTIFGQLDGSIYVSQNFKFRKPVFVGDEVIARLEIVATKEKGANQFVSCRTVIQDSAGDVCTDGDAMVMMPIVQDDSPDPGRQ